jgi:hypothetical protein
MWYNIFMDKNFGTMHLTDANNVKWTIETDIDIYGKFIWMHPDNVREKYSGFTGHTLGDVFEEFSLKGLYLYNDDSFIQEK